MSKTMSKGSIAEASEHIPSPMKKGNLKIQPHALPSLAEGLDDMGDGDDANETNRVVPVNIAHLKAYMQKKVHLKNANDKVAKEAASFEKD